MYSAIILAGGFGTRLRPLTDTVPKPMLPVGGEPNLVRLCELLCKNGFDSAVVTLKYLPDKIKEVLSDSCRGVDLYYICEDEPLGTAGAVKAAESLLADDFLVISGDAVCTLDLSAAFEEHKKSGAAATVITHTVKDPRGFGAVVCDKNGRITSFTEKPSWQQVVSDKVNTGIYFLSRRALDYIPAGKPSDFSRDIFPRMMENKEFLRGVEAPGIWRDIGSFAEFLAANRELAPENAEPVTEGSVYGDGFRLGRNSAFINSVAFDGVSIADNCSITGCILARNVTVGDGCVLRDGCVIGEGAVINDGVRLGSGTVIGTGKTVIKNREDKMIIKNKLFCGGGIALPQSEDIPYELCRIASAVSASVKGVVGVCCDNGGKSGYEAGLFAAALCDSGAAVYDFGETGRLAAALAGSYYGCELTVYVSPDGGGIRLSFYDITGMALTPACEKAITEAYLSERERGEKGEITKISGLKLLYLHALSASAPLGGVRVSVVASDETDGVNGALTAAGAVTDGKRTPYTEKDEFTLNASDGAMLLGQNGFFCSFDSCLLILLSLVQPEETPVVSLPCFLPQIYEKTAKKRGLRVMRYFSRPSHELFLDGEARKARLYCMWCHDPLFCAARLMSELKRNGFSLAEAADKYAGCVIRRRDIAVGGDEKASCMRRLYEAYMPYQVKATDGVSIVEGDAEGVAMADDSDRIRIVISADSEEAAEDAVAEIMMRMGKGSAG